MKSLRLHAWDVSPEEARRIQARLAKRVVLRKDFDRLDTVAGADVAFGEGGRTAFAAVSVYRFPSLERIEVVTAEGFVRFPYVPGLLSFREGPVLLDALARLRNDPDVILFDGQGIAHPRRFGLASHIGLLVNTPTIGCAKSRLTGEFELPAPKAGSTRPLREGEEWIGAVVRTRDRVRPVFVSPGHRIDIKASVGVVLGCLDGLRIPKPTREADMFVGRLKRGLRALDTV